MKGTSMSVTKIPKQPALHAKYKIFDKLDLIKEHLRIAGCDTARALQLVEQVEVLVESIEDSVS